VSVSSPPKHPGKTSNRLLKSVIMLNFLSMFLKLICLTLAYLYLVFQSYIFFDCIFKDSNYNAVANHYGFI